MCQLTSWLIILTDTVLLILQALMLFKWYGRWTHVIYTKIYPNWCNSLSFHWNCILSGIVTFVKSKNKWMIHIWVSLTQPIFLCHTPAIVSICSDRFPAVRHHGCTGHESPLTHFCVDGRIRTCGARRPNTLAGCRFQPLSHIHMNKASKFTSYGLEKRRLWIRIHSE